MSGYNSNNAINTHATAAMDDRIMIHNLERRLLLSSSSSISSAEVSSSTGAEYCGSSLFAVSSDASVSLSVSSVSVDSIDGSDSIASDSVVSVTAGSAASVSVLFVDISTVSSAVPYAWGISLEDWSSADAIGVATSFSNTGAVALSAGVSACCAGSTCCAGSVCCSVVSASGVDPTCSIFSHLRAIPP